MGCHIGSSHYFLLVFLNFDRDGPLLSHHHTGLSFDRFRLRLLKTALKQSEQVRHPFLFRQISVKRLLFRQFFRLKNHSALQHNRAHPDLQHFARSCSLLKDRIAQNYPDQSFIQKVLKKYFNFISFFPIHTALLHSNSPVL